MREKIWFRPNPIQCHGALLNQGLNTFGLCNLILWDIKLSTTKILSWPYGQQAEITEGAALHCCANFGFNAGTTNALQHWDIALNSSLNLFLYRAIWSCNLLSLLWCIHVTETCSLSCNLTSNPKLVVTIKESWAKEAIRITWLCSSKHALHDAGCWLVGCLCLCLGWVLVGWASCHLEGCHRGWMTHVPTPLHWLRTPGTETNNYPTQPNN